MAEPRNHGGVRYYSDSVYSYLHPFGRGQKSHRRGADRAGWVGPPLRLGVDRGLPLSIPYQPPATRKMWMTYSAGELAGLLHEYSIVLIVG